MKLSKLLARWSNILIAYMSVYDGALKSFGNNSETNTLERLAILESGLQAAAASWAVCI